MTIWFGGRNGVPPEHGRSAEEEHGRLLRAASRSDGRLDRLVQMSDAGVDAFERDAELPRDVDL